MKDKEEANKGKKKKNSRVQRLREEQSRACNPPSAHNHAFRPRFHDYASHHIHDSNCENDAENEWDTELDTHAQRRC